MAAYKNKLMEHTLMKKPMTKMLFFVGVFFVLIFGWYGVKKVLFIWYMSHYQPPPVTISATKATTKTWFSYLTAVGTLSAVNGVELSSEISGIVKELRFQSGQLIKKGELIVVLDTAIEEANLKSQQAKLQLAKINYNREKTLFNKKVASQANLDSRYAELLQAEAGVEYIQAQIKQKNITAPFDGKLGIRLVNLGQYISPGTPIVTLQTLNPLYVMFNLPEQHLAHLHLNQDVEVSVNFGTDKILHGKLTAINSKVDQITRNLLVQATIPNENLQLYPGMYGLVRIWLQEKKNTIAVPQTAVSYSLSGNYVFLIKEEEGSKKEKLLKVYRQYVKIGERRMDEVSILDGLKPGDRLVTSGQLKLQNGTSVIIDTNVDI